MKPSAEVGYYSGTLLGIALLVFFLLPGQQSMLSSGPANVGHEDVACEQCHEPSPGTSRQQIQTYVRYWLGQRSEPVDFGSRAISNEACLKCHQNPRDVHPVYRFNEPRFAGARKTVAAQSCVSCHQSHNGVRVTVGPDFCVACHQDTKVSNDPLDVPHQQLVATGRWDTCLGCHDYHNNHVMVVESKLDNKVTSEEIRRYFDGGPSPYSDKKYFKVERPGAPQ
jgi:hypothetical protein